MPGRVIIAEDELVIAMSLRSELMKEGYEVVAIATTGTQALDLCFQHHPDVVLMDIRMPDMDGLEATSRIMNACPACVIIVTGKADTEEEAKRAGAMGYLVKPVTGDELFSVIEAARERFAQQMAAPEGPGEST